MILSRSLALVALAGSISGGAFAQCGNDRADFAPPTTFAAQRQAHASIDEAIAAMPSGDLHGTFNRLSAVFNRSQVDSLLVGDGECGNIPDNVVASVHATLADLAEDVASPSFDGSTDQEAVMVFQLIRNYAFMPNLSLHEGNTFCYTTTNCVPHPEGPPNPPVCTVTFCPTGNDPAVYDDLDAVIGVINPLYKAIRFRAMSDPDFATYPTPPSLDGNNFVGAITNLGLVTGVESIDY